LNEIKAKQKSDTLRSYGRTERPVHLPLHAVTVQHMNEVLLLLHLNGNFTDTDGFTGKILSYLRHISQLFLDQQVTEPSRVDLTYPLQFLKMLRASPPTSSFLFPPHLMAPHFGLIPLSSIQKSRENQRMAHPGMSMQHLRPQLLLLLA
jgi:hypothetical protein